MDAEGTEETMRCPWMPEPRGTRAEVLRAAQEPSEAGAQLRVCPWLRVPVAEGKEEVSFFSYSLRGMHEERTVRQGNGR